MPFCSHKKTNHARTNHQSRKTSDVGPVQSGLFKSLLHPIRQHRNKCGIIMHATRAGQGNSEFIGKGLGLIIEVVEHFGVID